MEIYGNELLNFLLSPTSTFTRIKIVIVNNFVVIDITKCSRLLQLVVYGTLARFKDYYPFAYKFRH